MNPVDAFGINGSRRYWRLLNGGNQVCLDVENKRNNAQCWPLSTSHRHMVDESVQLVLEHGCGSEAQGHFHSL